MICSRTGNGLRYAVLQEGRKVACCSLSVRCGTREENVLGWEKTSGNFHSGTAHFVEHALFKGTEDKSASVINGYLERLGGELNAYTTKEEIVLHTTVLREDVEKAAGLLMEMATRAVFPEGEIEVEKTVVMDEIAGYKDSPADDIYDRFESLLFEGHPLSGRVLGTSSSVKKITPGELRRYVAAFFVPERISFSVVSPLPEEEAAAMVGRLVGEYFGEGDGVACVPASDAEVSDMSVVSESSDMTAVSDGAASADSAESERCPALSGEFPGNVFNKTVNRHSHQANCIIGATAPSLYREKERIAASLMANILGGPATNSVLNSVLREEKGWVYNVECNYSQYADSGVMAICFGCDRERLDDCIRAIDGELLTLRTVPLSEEHLLAAKKQFIGQLTISSENSESQALSLCKSLNAFGTVQDDDAVRRKIEAVTPGDILAAASAIFNPDRLSRLVYL